MKITDKTYWRINWVIGGASLIVIVVAWIYLIVSSLL